MAGTSTSSYTVHAPSGRKTFGYLKSARTYAQSEANQSGRSVQIDQNRHDGKRAKTYTVYPKKSANPRSTPRGRWMNGKVRVTKGGKIEFQSSNPVKRTYKTKGGFTGLRSMLARRRSKKQVGRAFGTDPNQRYLVDVDAYRGRVYSRTFAAAKRKGESIARKTGKSKFYIQNQVTGSIINFEIVDK